MLYFHDLVFPYDWQYFRNSIIPITAWTFNAFNDDNKDELVNNENKLLSANYETLGSLMKQ
jgi:hypothetical protein